MKRLFIYYSYTGNGDFVANYLKQNDFDIRKVIRKKKLPKSFFFGVLAGGFLAGIKHKDIIVDFDEDVLEYDEIVIGSPIWNGRFASPINTVLSKLDLRGKNVTFILYSGSGEGAKALKRIKKEYPEAKVYFLREPKKNPDELLKLSHIIK